MTPGHVLVGVDGSDHAHRALELGRLLARALGDELVVVHAVGLLDRPGPTPVAAASHRDEIARAFQQGLVRAARRQRPAVPAAPP